MKRLFYVLRWIPAAIIICVSWHLSSLSTIEHVPTFWNADKVVHFFCFAGLAFWVCFAFGGLEKNRRARFWATVAFVSLYGIVDEIHQSFTPGRFSSVFDWMADTLGAAFGAFVFLLLIKFLKRK